MNQPDECFLLEPLHGYGGNREMTPARVLLRRTMAIGDAIAATTVAQKLVDRGLSVTLQTDPMIGTILRRSPSLAGVAPPNGFCHVNLDKSYEISPQRTKAHMYRLFFERATEHLARHGMAALGPTINCKPRLTVSPEEKLITSRKLEQYPPPWIFICPRSHSFRCRTVPDDIWQAAAERMPGTKFWLGLFDAPAGLVDLKVRSMELLPVVIACADIMVTVDTGPMHIAAALGVPIVAINQSSSPDLHLSDQCDFDTVSPVGLDCLNCQKNICPIKQFEPPCQNVDPETIAEMVNRKLKRPKVSAIIPIYRPTFERLIRCLECVLPQVDEVIITGDAGAILPAGVIQDRKARFVRCEKDRIGFGRNVNFGARKSSGELLLILNDDVYLGADNVQRLRDCLKDNVALVGQLLRYPDGRIYHGGVGRAAGSLDWGHIDHGRFEPTITAPMEMEQVTGASILLRRDVFYKVDGFDERFFMYCEDNDLCMKVRQAGYRVFYTPLASGIHEGSASSGEVPRISEIMADSIRMFHSKWDWYLKKNLGNTLGKF